MERTIPYQNPQQLEEGIASLIKAKDTLYYWVDSYFVNWTKNTLVLRCNEEKFKEFESRYIKEGIKA